MTVYGEETLEIQINKGLFLSDTGSSIPEGYCSSFKNVVVDEAGYVTSRPNFHRVPTGTILTGITNALMNSSRSAISAQYVPSHEYEEAVRFWGFNSPLPSTYNPGMLVVSPAASVGNITAAWTRGDNTVNSMSIAKAEMPMCGVQYRDRYYFIRTDSTVMRWNFTAANTIAITSIQLLASYTFNTLVAFRDRLFAFSTKSRIFFTDLATSGGYPETWGSNFIEMPGNDTIIKAAYAHNDRIYIFTTSGVYQLYAKGSPSTWDIQLIDPTVRVNSTYSVSLIEGLFIYTDEDDVYYFDGNSKKSIGTPVRAALRGDIYNSGSLVFKPTGTRVIPFGDGFLLSLNFLQPDLSTGTYWADQSNDQLYYYFDGVRWSQYTFDTNVTFANNIHKSIIGGAKNMRTLPVNYSSMISNYNVFCELRQTSVGVYEIQFLTPLKTNRIDHGSTFGYVSYPWEVTTAEFSLSKSSPRFSRLKRFVLNIKNSMRSVNTTVYSDGTAETTIVNSLGASPYTSILQIPVESERAESTQLKMNGTWNDTSAGFNQSTTSFPSIRINGIHIIFNSDTRTIPNQNVKS